MSKKREPRLTEQLSLALSKAQAAASIGKENPDMAKKGCQMAYDALNEA